MLLKFQIARPNPKPADTETLGLREENHHFILLCQAHLMYFKM